MWCICRSLGTPDDAPLDYFVEAIPEEPERRGFDFFSVFRRKSVAERPVSAMAIVQQRRTSPVVADNRRKLSDSRGHIMDLLRRSSVGSESTSSIPREALLGLSDSERQHIEQVLQAASKHEADR